MWEGDQTNRTRKTFKMRKSNRCDNNTGNSRVRQKVRKREKKRGRVDKV